MEYKIKDFYLAVFLLLKRKKMIGMNKINNKEVEFVFQEDGNIKDLIQKYNFGEKDDKDFLVNIREVEIVIKELKKKIYNVLYSSS